MKNIEGIVKKVALRYNVAYNGSSSGPKMKYIDGSTRSLNREELEKLFSKPDGSEDWHQVKSVRIKVIRKQLNDSSDEHDRIFNFEELAEMTS
ncbi:hypothetical protein [Gudongella sp. DL1XJH-153]|uniref:hypothetical protein n=1 Tax=Gudongella sp. DL1XJH-153 TaxID=3409804 RepID=UPI003BB7A24D